MANSKDIRIRMTPNTAVLIAGETYLDDEGVRRHVKEKSIVIPIPKPTMEVWKPANEVGVKALLDSVDATVDEFRHHLYNNIKAGIKSKDVSITNKHALCNYIEERYMKQLRGATTKRLADVPEVPVAPNLLLKYASHENYPSEIKAVRKAVTQQ